jgi:hypothetical protein
LRAITLTMDCYTHGIVGDQRAALAALPDLSALGRKEKAGGVA